MTWRHPRALALALLAAVCLAPAARAGRVAVVVTPPFDPADRAAEGAVGLLVPGAGSTVTRAGALSSLVRGKTVSSLLGGTATGPPEVALSRAPAAVTIYVSLPPPGRSHNTRRYPIAIVGGDYHGLLVSHTTRIPGLVSIADVAPTAVALGEGRTPRIRSRADAAAPATLAALDRRLDRSHDARDAATIVLVAATLGLAGLGLLLRSAVLARAGLLAIPAALTASFVLSHAGLSPPGQVTAVLAAATVLGALAGALRERALVPLLVLFLAAGTAALAAWPDVNALSVIGPHPDGGGRFYGITNEVETLLLAPVLALAAAVAPVAVVPVAVLSLLLVGWSRAGADGGGIVVVLVAIAVFWARREGIRPTPTRVALAVVALAGLALAAVGLDALAGGSSHVTGAVGDGPAALAHDLGHRLRISWHGLTATTQAEVTAAANLAALALLALLPRRSLVVDALLVALVVSLLVNDTPTDVIAYGALAGAALRVWATVDAPVSRRSGAGAFLPASPAPLSRSRRPRA